MASITSTMSDEESFVVLGSSPLPSLSYENESQREKEAKDVEEQLSEMAKDLSVEWEDAGAEEADSPGSAFSSLRRSQLQTLQGAAAEEQPTTSTIAATPVTVAEPAEAVQEAAATMTTSAASSGVAKTNTNVSSLTDFQSMARSAGSSNGMNNSVRSAANGGEASLAASFIMGEINADVLKTSVYSQFPSLCSMEACAEDVVKLQNFMTEYLELKNTLSKVNLTMKQFYTKTQQWRADMLRMEEQYKQQLQECQTQIAALRNENLELKREVNEKMEQMKLFDDLRKKDHTELMQDISEKTAHINNMRAHIEKLEQQQLATFEYVPKNENDTKEKPDYVDRLEHNRVVKDFQRQLSELLAENLEMKDMKKQYIDEINCLKVNHTSAEELIKQMSADINLLKAKDIEKTETFMRFEGERERMREEMSLLQEQVIIYSKDFELERTARQNAAGEKDQLLQDLRAMQRRNQDLIEELDRCSVSSRATAAAAAVARPSPPPSFNAAAAAAAVYHDVLPSPSAASRASISARLFCCPVCNKQFQALTVLESHINACLDKN